MKQRLLIGLLSTVGALGGAQAAIPVDIQFDGYCDGMTGLVEVANNGVTGVWSNLDCAGTDAPVGGPIGKSRGESDHGFIVGSSGVSAPYGSEFVWSINLDGTWTVRRAMDGLYINHGTYTVVNPGQRVHIGTRPAVSF